MARKITDAARQLLAEAAQDYANGWGRDATEKAETKTDAVMHQLAAQRAANRLWGRPDESRDGGA